MQGANQHEDLVEQHQGVEDIQDSSIKVVAGAKDHGVLVEECVDRVHGDKQHGVLVDVVGNDELLKQLLLPKYNNMGMTLPVIEQTMKATCKRRRGVMIVPVLGERECATMYLSSYGAG